MTKFILVLWRILKKQLVMCSNVYDNFIDFEISFFIKNIKIWISWERNKLIIKWKNPLMLHEGLSYGKMLSNIGNL